MSYDTHLTSPYQAARELGRAALAGVGLLNTPVTLRGTSMLRTRAPILVTPNKKRRIQYEMAIAPTQAPTLYQQSGRRRYMNRLGRKVGSFSTRRHTIEEPHVADVPDKVVHWDGLMYIPRHTATEDPEDVLNKRTGKNCNVRGVRFQMNFQLNNIRNTPLTTDGVPVNALPYFEPIKVRWAVLNPKDQEANTIFNPAAPPEFFISKNPTGTSMTEDFSPLGSHWKLLSRKINREKYNVLKEGAFMLHNVHEQNHSSGGSANYARLSPTSFKRIKVYIPINKQVQFNGTDGTPEYNLYFVFWYCQANAEEGVGSFGATPAIEYNSEKTTYFKNSLMYR